MRKGENIVFVISLPRSGSTLLQKILASNKMVYSTGEPWLLLPILYSNFYNIFTLPGNEKYDSSWAKKPIDSFFSEITDFDHIFKESGASFYQSAVNSILKDKNKSFFVDKTPRYYFIIDSIIKYFPNAKIILLYRDPLDILYSIISTWLKTELPLLINYKYDITVGLDELNKGWISKNILNVHYEELITNTQSTIKDICSFIGIEFEERMIEYEKIRKINYNIGDFNNLSKDSISSSSVSKWKAVNNYKHWKLLKDYLYFIGKDKYQKFGYDFEEAEKAIWKIRETLRKPLFSYSLNFLLSDFFKNLEKLFHAKRKMKKIIKP